MRLLKSRWGSVGISALDVAAAAAIKDFTDSLRAMADVTIHVATPGE
jgi:hypothetical protein